MAGGSKLNDYIDDSFKANSDDDDDDDDEIEEPKLLPHSLFTVAVGRCCAVVYSGAATVHSVVLGASAW